MSVFHQDISFSVTELFYFSVCRFALLTTASCADRQHSYVKTYTFYFRVRISPPLRQTSMTLLEVIQTKNIVNFGLATFIAAALLGNTPPAKAETPDIFTKHGLPIPGAYFAKKENQQRLLESKSRLRPRLVRSYRSKLTWQTRPHNAALERTMCEAELWNHRTDHVRSPVAALLLNPRQVLIA
jgi:hypothetical protein